ncbi:MAG TPA: hypothetical protein VGJ18_12265 [Gemmatimonadaceae bacterium]
MQLFLDDNAAVLAAIVDLTAARKRLDAVAANFTGHAYDQDASARGAKGEAEKQRQLRLKLRGQQMEPIARVNFVGDLTPRHRAFPRISGSSRITARSFAYRAKRSHHGR